ncbi:putative aldouronate transport system permease protein [Eubacterium ruminantium]|nr:putative aldouronate transport system permease protein [Eubacterium ruminantium]
MGKDVSEPTTYSVDMAREKELENQVLTIDKKKKKTKEPAGVVYAVHRITALLMFFLIFIPGLNPAKITALVSKNLSLFTSAVSYSRLTENVGRGFRKGWVTEEAFQLLFVGAIITLIAIVIVSAGACINLGNNKCKRLSFLVNIVGLILLTVGLIIISKAYGEMKNAANPAKVQAEFSSGIWFYAILGGIILILTILEFVFTPIPAKKMKYEIETKYKLFLMFLPFAILAFIFCYLPLWGWRYSFFDYKAGDELTSKSFVGFKWFKYLFQNSATRAELVRVLRNTLAMSGLGILTSWIPLAFAVFLTEIKSKKFKRVVQTFTTIPNFISWILVYTVAIAIFSTDGFINTIFGSTGNHLMGDNFTWLKMLAWGIWKGVGWGAIIYIAGIAGIDKQLYEAATVDGAGRFQRIWHVTIPGLMPTFMVMLLLSVAGMLSNGLDQYLVFGNASNMNHMEVLDLYVYHLGFGGGSIPLSTVIGMAKSLVSVALLFMANGISKMVRKESII